MKTKAWILLFSLLCFLLAGLSAFLFLGGEQAGYAEVYSGGKLIVTLDLSKDTEYLVESSEAWNLLAVHGGRISVISASCPSQDCVHHAPANRGAPIVCLPNRLVIKFTNSSALDALIG